MDTYLVDDLDVQIKQMDQLMAMLAEQLEETKKKTKIHQLEMDLQLWMIGYMENQIAFCEIQKNKLVQIRDNIILKISQKND